jgi:DNA polymerase III delta' subunit
METALERTGFSGILGQERACQGLLSALRSRRVPHAYLFAGPDGVGKRTVARQWIKMLNCERPASDVEPCESCAGCRKVESLTHPDVLWVDFAFQAALLKEPVEKQKALKIDTVREMEKILQLKPLEGRVKVACLSPAEHLVEAAAHALLKILEEPPPKTHLILIAQDPGQILGTLRSRCQWVRFRPLAAESIATHLLNRVDHPTEAEARAAAFQAEGSLSRALEILSGAEELSFAWDAAPLPELLRWCEQFQNPRLGREAAARFLRRLLALFQSELHQGLRPAEDARRVLDALQQIRQNVTPSLVLQVLLLKLRRGKKSRNAG